MTRISLLYKLLAGAIFITSIFLSCYVGQCVNPTWTLEKVVLDVESDQDGRLFYTIEDERKWIENAIPYEEAQLHPDKIAEYNANGQEPPVTEEFVTVSGEYRKLTSRRHWQFWSLLPPLLAILLCWLLQEPVLALASGIISAALILGHFDVVDEVLIPGLTNTSAIETMVLFWILGSLLGIWSKNGAARAFADYMTQRFVRGPRSAKLVGWFLGLIFCQGTTISSIFVGTTVKPVADRERVSHEELSLVVDSTSAPIAILLPFNGWPGYVQAFLYVSGVAWLATEHDRLAFFFQSLPLSFYAIFAVFATFLISIEKFPFMGKKLAAALQRARETGQLDAPGAAPLSAKELETSDVPEGYTPHVLEFVIPLAALLGIAIVTYIVMGSPKIRWAFGVALLLAMIIAALRGLSLKDLINGMISGWKGVILAVTILALAIPLGGAIKDLGAASYLVELLGDTLPYYILPATLLLLAIIVSFSTGTSWGTFAVAFPLAMPLAHAIAIGNGLAHPKFYTMICFSAVLNGAVYGDQCSPISDSTILSAMSTGCDLMDHVKTQIPVATMAAGCAAVCWTICTFFA